MHIELDSEELIAVLAVVVVAEASNAAAHFQGEEDSAEEREAQKNLHTAGHKLAEAAGYEYHDSVRSAVRAALNKTVARIAGIRLEENGEGFGL